MSSGSVELSEECDQKVSNRYQVMEELNQHFRERIQNIEKTGYTDLLVTHLKKWIETLVTQDKVLVETIESLEQEVLERSDSLTQLCEERRSLDQMCQEYKKELSEKTDLINELNSRLTDEAEALNQKESTIKRLNQELEQIKNSLDNLKSKSNQEEQSLRFLESEVESSRKELGVKESKIKSLEQELTCCQSKLPEIESEPREKKNNLQSESDSSVHIKDLMNQIVELELKIASKNRKIEEHSVKIQRLQGELDSRCKELDIFRLNGTSHVEGYNMQMDHGDNLQMSMPDAKKKFFSSRNEIESLQKQLELMKASGDSDMVTLERKIELLRQESRDMKEALTAEVAEKHDMIISLRRDTAQLEEKARQADMQAIFKDDIIKELRKEVKLARAKESFVEMLGLNEGSRVQMKSKIDSLTAELEEKESEIQSLENKLEEMNRHALEGKLGEMSLQLMDRERDMIILCNKVDYIKRYLDKLHEDEDISIKCGLKALLLELNEETEWRRKARRSVTSLGDQPESVIIINRSNSLPAEPSEHVRYNGRVNELEIKLDRAREEICCLRRKLEAKELELNKLKEKTCLSEDNNKLDKIIIPDSMLSLKLEEFQRFTDEAGTKLQETIDNVKQHAENLLLKEDMDEFGSFFIVEQETFSKATRQLHVLLCNIKNTMNMPANHKIQCLETKLKSTLDLLEKEKKPNTNNKGSSVALIEHMIVKIKESLKIVCDLKDDSSKVASTSDPSKTEKNSKLIHEIQEMIQLIQNQSKNQQSKLFAILDYQKEERGCLKKKFSEVDCLLKSHCESINYVKGELKMALSNVTARAEKVRNQVEGIVQFECSVKEIANWFNHNVKSNSEIMSKITSLQRNLQQIMSIKKSLDSKKQVNEVCTSMEPELNGFEDKCLEAREVCCDIVKQLDKASCQISHREEKLTELCKDISCFGQTLYHIQDDLIRISHMLSGEDAECSNCFSSYKEAAINLLDCNKEILKSLHIVKQKLVVHHRQSDNHDIKAIECRRTVDDKLKELEFHLQHMAEILKKSQGRELSVSLSNKQLNDEVGDKSLSVVRVRSRIRKSLQRRSCSTEALWSQDCVYNESDSLSDDDNNKIITPAVLIQQLQDEICTLNATITSLQKQNGLCQSTIESLHGQLAKTKEEADKTIQHMVSQLQERSQSMEANVDFNDIIKMCKQNKMFVDEIRKLKLKVHQKCERINMLRKEYSSLTLEVNNLTKRVQIEKEESLCRQNALELKNEELCEENDCLKKKLEEVCQALSSAKVKPFHREGRTDEEEQRVQKTITALKEKYDCLVKEHSKLYDLHVQLRQRWELQEQNLSRLCEERESRVLVEDVGCLTDRNEDVVQLKGELDRITCEKEQLLAEVNRLNRGHRQSRETDCEKQTSKSTKELDWSKIDNVLTRQKCLEDQLAKCDDENRTLRTNNDLLSMVNKDLEKDLKEQCDRVLEAEKALKCLQSMCDTAKMENEMLNKDKIQLRKELSNQLLMREEECNEILALKQLNDEIKKKLHGAELTIEDFKRKLLRKEKETIENALLDATTQALTSNPEKQWNEIFVRKCSEVKELTEQVDCLRRDVETMTCQLAEKDNIIYEAREIIAKLKITIQDYKSQITLLKSQLNSSVNSQWEIQRELCALESRNRTMKQFMLALDQEKKELTNRLNRMQYEDCNTDENSCAS